MPKRLPKLTPAIIQDLRARAGKTEEARERQRQREFDAFLAQMRAPGDPIDGEDDAG